MQQFEERLKGGHPNSLGNTIEVVEEVLAQPIFFDELFHCYFSKDEVVRLRVSNAMKRVGKADKSILLPYIDRFLNEISKIEQASTQWTLAQLFLLLEKGMNKKQIDLAKQIMQHNLSHSTDWIVLNMTMETLGKWAKKDTTLREWLLPYLEQLAVDERKSVKNKASKVLKVLK